LSVIDGVTAARAPSGSAVGAATSVDASIVVGLTTPQLGATPPPGDLTAAWAGAPQNMSASFNAATHTSPKLLRASFDAGSQSQQQQQLLDMFVPAPTLATAAAVAASSAAAAAGGGSAAAGGSMGPGSFDPAPATARDASAMPGNTARMNSAAAGAAAGAPLEIALGLLPPVTDVYSYVAAPAPAGSILSHVRLAAPPALVADALAFLDRGAVSVYGGGVAGGSGAEFAGVPAGAGHAGRHSVGPPAAADDDESVDDTADASERLDFRPVRSAGEPDAGAAAAAAVAAPRYNPNDGSISDDAVSGSSSDDTGP
jgi:hypothetical protein